ncbi:alpha/beta hydrolase [Streptomyces massasporeus]|uniref:alpha/beta hydrolase n=1 Tax=Streptomyces massasporeus TaxID=67324 RepID=UPI0037BAA4C1
MAIKNTSGQATAMSDQAASFLEKTPALKLPSWLFPAMTTASMINRFRKQLQDQEEKIEQALVDNRKLRLEADTIAGVPVVNVVPPAITPGLEDTVVLNIHGGAFVMGTARERTALLVASELGVRVCSVDYTLSPEAPYPTALNECLTVYEHLLTQYGPSRIAGTSSSSGGSLMLAMLHRIHAQDLPMMAATALFTPAADISGTGDSMVANRGRDVLHPGMAQALTRHYVADNDPRDPLISPLYGDFHSTYPPTIITTGTRDILASGSVRLYWKLRAAGVPAELRIGEGMWHGFNWEPELPEALLVRRDVTDFLAHRLGARD